MKVTPYWDTAGILGPLPRLSRDLEADVVVIGAGITGITTAYLIKQTGRTVALIDRGRLGGVDTAVTTAHVTCVTDMRPSALVKSYGEDHARAVWDAGLAAIGQIAECVEVEKNRLWLRMGARVSARACRRLRDGRSDRLVAPRGGPRVEARFRRALRRRGADNESARRRNRRAGEVPSTPLPQGTPRSDHRRRRIRIREHRGRRGRGRPARGRLRPPPHQMWPCRGGDAQPDRRQGWPRASHGASDEARALHELRRRRARGDGRHPGRVVWDTSDPYRYLRIDRRRDFDVAILGGEDHKTGQVDDRVRRFEILEDALRALAPAVEMTHHWSGQVIETADGLPFIGEIVHRAVDGDRVFGQWHDLRDARRDHGEGLR